MKLIVVSSPTDFPGEHAFVHALMEAGLEYFHLRKPQHSQEELEAYLKQLKPAYLKKVIIHQHHKLIEKYNLRGIHLKEHYYDKLTKTELGDLLQNARRKNIHVSLSLHSRQKLEALTEKFQYVFLSPVFDSLSKTDYKAAEDFGTLPPDLKNNTIALGGIDAQTLHLLEGKNFSGAAVLGAIWNKAADVASPAEVQEIFRNLHLQVQQLAWKQKSHI